MANSNGSTDRLQSHPNRVKAKSSQVIVNDIISAQETVSQKEEEQQLNVWIPKDLMKRLKVKGIETDRSLKEMVAEALEQFL